MDKCTYILLLRDPPPVVRRVLGVQLVGSEVLP